MVFKIGVCMLLALAMTLQSAPPDICTTPLLNCTCANTSNPPVHGHHIDEQFLSCQSTTLKVLPQLLYVNSIYRKVAIKNTGLSQLKRANFAANIIRKLDLSHNMISSIDAAAFDTFMELEELNLAHNQLEELPSMAFASLKDLTNLDLSFNKLRQFDPMLFVPVRSLNRLSLRFNPITGKSFAFISVLQKLDTLDLQGIGMFDNVTMAQTVYSVRILDLSSNKFNRVPNNFLRKFSNLYELELSGNDIEEIDSESFKNVTTLSRLSLNYLFTLTKVKQGAFEPLRNLSYLSLSCNPQLQTVDQEAFQLWNTREQDIVHLKELKMRQNGLTELSDTLVDWSSLEVLDLQENPWHCDCNLRWMKKLGRTNGSRINLLALCHTPLKYRDRLIVDLYDKDFQCFVDIHRLMQDRVFVSFLMLLFCLSILIAFGLGMVCWYLRVCNSCRAKMQLKYRKLNPELSAEERVSMEITTIKVY